MSQTRWPSLFKPATYGPLVAGGPARELVSAGELSPQDLVAHEVRHYLSQDAVLARVFGGRFEMQPWLAQDARVFPRCVVYLASTFPSERPTATSIELVSVFVGTLWDAKAAEPIADGNASVATVNAHVRRALRAERARVLAVWYGGQQVQLAHELVRFAPERYGPLTTVEGRVTGIVHEIEVEYRLHVDRSGTAINLL